MLLYQILKYEKKGDFQEKATENVAAERNLS